MKAAVVTEFGRAPRIAEHPLPPVLGDYDEIVDVVAAGLHPRVRSQAEGSHYSSTDELPLVPGIDGVGRTARGELRYFVLPDTALGSMATRTVIDRRRSIALPEGVDPVRIAAAMNPAMSSWIALRRRIRFEPGQSVLVLGATGSAGGLAVQVAKKLGAGRVIAAGRGAERLAGLGADEIVELDGSRGDASVLLAQAARDVDVVLDYLWGQPTHDALTAIVPARDDDSQQLSWVQIGSAAGLDAVIPSAALRATRLQLVGSGQGSVPTRDIVDELGRLAGVLASDQWAIHARALPLDEIERAWSAPPSGERIVIVP